MGARKRSSIVYFIRAAVREEKGAPAATGGLGGERDGATAAAARPDKASGAYRHTQDFTFAHGLHAAAVQAQRGDSAEYQCMKIANPDESG